MEILNYSEKRDFEKVLLLYQDAKWFAYLEDLECLKRAYQSSIISFVVYEQEDLVGVIRAVGDGETILYIQDIIVHSSSRRQNIGSDLVTHLLTEYSHVRQTVLLTDNDANTVSFYESLGFKKVDDYNCVAFAKM
ncbi:MAG: GNAT family N-acetyltransferase [Erysipelothrix sp.]